ncbi:hypothetical protein L9F63_023266, partial [Diploptera punctata]
WILIIIMIIKKSLYSNIILHIIIINRLTYNSVIPFLRIFICFKLTFFLNLLPSS